ncbi:hypothetical protein GOP47_0007636 [Adiantum capillus-veneris]|uniref:Vacuolar cation/proton exchanger n=1 Tax=Adiantum capillus-veneris TaxID=13818 RepID=A0A9D4ZL45_ADICA|nr:hypothetical protein GOP47_0007636 [Adiantum capillus-veneris]
MASPTPISHFSIDVSIDAHKQSSDNAEANPFLEDEFECKRPLTSDEQSMDYQRLTKPNGVLNHEISLPCDNPHKVRRWFCSSAAHLRRHGECSWHVLSGSKIWWLLPAVIAAIVVKVLGLPQAYLFTFSLLGIAPLAERLGFVTEQLANFTGATVGGLLNATFGNATEMIISLFALQNGLTRVVQLSLLGSILSNMLLVLGCAFFSGGLVHMQGDQKFNQAAAVVNSGLLLMAVMGLLFPAVLHSTHTEVHDGLSELNLSRFSSCIMLIAYASYLYFQLKSHRQLYDPPDDAEESGGESEDVSLSLKGALMWLGALTLFISILSNYLVDAIEEASSSLSIPLAFISVIILPIVGNAAEHASAIMFAVKDKLDLSLAVAIGSSTQISMFVIPFCVVVGWIAGKPMDLNFQLFETATLFTTVIVVAFMLQEGKANYFKGLMLVLCYLIVGASFFVHNDIPGGEDKGKN